KATNEEEIQSGTSSPPIDEKPNILTIKEVLISNTFALLYATLFLNTVWCNTKDGLFKAYGLEFIHDDFFLAILSSVSSVISCGSLIVYGILVDKVGYQKLMLITCAIGSVFMWAIPGVRWVGNRYLYFFWICMMDTVNGATYTLLPYATNKFFGHDNFGIAYGLLMTSLTLAGLTTSLCSQFLLPLIGYEYLFVTIGCFLFTSLILTAFFHKTKYGSA
uniref:Uncharacterized protein n=1 Tax=Acrobeloides nanus TaxID=290746 RepID=A0A914D2V7_9BILA